MLREMGIPLPRFSSWWGWGGKYKENCSRNSEAVKFRSKISPSPRKKVRRKWKSREEKRIDKEFDVVLVPSDGVSFSETDSGDDDDSDWSIGWLEPHSADFRSGNESDDDSFAVLVPCYRHDCKDFEEKKKPNNDYYLGDKNYMEQWISSLRNF